MITTLRALPVILALTALTSAAAFADHDHDDRDHDGDHDRYYDHAPRPVYVSAPEVVVRPSPPPGRPIGGGQYVLQSQQRWVDGAFEQVWVPGSCWSKHNHGHKAVCRSGFYDSQWQPGHYVAVQEWVWVPVYPHFPRATYYPAPVVAPVPYGHVHASASVPLPGLNVQVTGSF